MSPLPLRADRAQELERLFAAPVELVWARDLAALGAALETTSVVHAVALDAVAPAEQATAEALCRGVTVLRPRREEARTARGERVARFAGYAVGPEPMADGALAELLRDQAALPPVA